MHILLSAHLLLTQTSPGVASSCGAGGATGSWTRYEAGEGFYEVLAPAGEGPFPLVVAMHGDEGIIDYSKMDWEPTWQTHGGFVVVAPQSPTQHMQANHADTGWDNFPDESAAFIEAVVVDVGERYPVDVDRMYITGKSAGGFWMGQRGFTFQDVFAAGQFSCGASSLAIGLYSVPMSNPACMMAARFEAAPSDHLFDEHEALRGELEARGHTVEWSESACSGHCCGGPEIYGEAAWQFFTRFTKCGTTQPAGCYDIREIPGFEGPAPTLSIVTPATDTRFAVGEQVEVLAEASGERDISQVRFYLNEQLHGSRFDGPYRTVFADLSEGIYTVRVEAIDDIGQDAEASVRFAVGNAPFPDPPEMADTGDTGLWPDSTTGQDQDGAAQGCGCRSGGEPWGSGTNGLAVVLSFSGLALRRRRRRPH